MSKLKFNLAKVKITPLCHLRILRHANESHQRNVFGQLYGALYQHSAEVTNVMPLPDNQQFERDQLDKYQRNYQDNLAKFELDNEKVGWYCISYKRNFWDNIQACKHYESYIQTSFFLVFDYTVTKTGGNPYKAYRLKKEFAEKQNFTWRDLTEFNRQKNNPYQQIPVQVTKNPISEALFELNKTNLFTSFRNINNKDKSKNESGRLQNEIKHYGEIIEECGEKLKTISQNYLRVKEEPNNQKKPIIQRPIELDVYCTFLTGNFTLEGYSNHFSKHEKNLQESKKILELVLE